METKQFTPIERLAIYKEAYKLLFEYEPKNQEVFYSLCWDIHVASNLEISWYEFELDNYNFIELLKRKPKNLFDSVYWFDHTEKKPRLDILQQCINEVTQLIENGGE